MNRALCARPVRRRLLALCAGLALGASAAAPAHATPETLKRAVSNIVGAPFDVLLAPIVGTQIVVNNLQDIDDSLGVRIAYPLPGVVWKTAETIGVGVIRCITGLIELVPGLILLFSDTDLDPLLAPAEDADAMVDIETPVLYIRFGLYYTG